MKKLTALLIVLFAFAMLTGPSVASELLKQLSPNAFGTGDIPDGVSYEEFGGTIDQHYGVAPAWEVRSEEPLTMIEKAENDLRRHLAPNILGNEYFADGVSYDEFRGTSDTHYGVAPTWEDRPEDLTVIEKADRELWKHLAPNVIYQKDVN